MSKQAQVGAFAIVALLLLFGVFYVITDFGTRQTGYRVGIHFQSAAGLTPGALVYFSGVNVGSVDSIQLLPDNTVDVILAVNRDIDIPLASRFLIQAPLTGTPNVIIVPPRPSAEPGPLLARTVLPVDRQPQGTNSATIADLLEEGQGQIKRLSAMLGMMEARTPKLLDSLQTTLDNANDLTMTAKSSMQQLAGQLLALTTTLQSSLSSASGNIDQLTGTLNVSARTDSQKVAALLTQFQSTSTALNASMRSLQSIATDPHLKSNVLETTKNIAELTQTLAKLSDDLRQVTGNPQTQAQMRDTVANIDATMQRANSLLGALGGKSNVYGVDAAATPYPSAAGAVTPYPLPPSARIVPASNVPAAHLPSVPPLSATAAPANATSLHDKLGKIAKSLVQLQLRLYELSPQHACCANPALPSNRGPSGDLHLTFLPGFSTSFLIGADAIGNRTTYDAALLKRLGPDAHVGGGVLYSQLGITGDVGLHGPLGFQGYLYDPRYPMLDLYGNVRIMPGTTLFFGQRDILHAARRNVIGLQHIF